MSFHWMNLFVLFSVTSQVYLSDVTEFGIIIIVTCCCECFTCYYLYNFSVAASMVWNSLPASVKSEGNIVPFRRRLETYLFNAAYPP